MNSFILAVVLGTVLMCSIANAETWHVNGRQVDTKVEALMSLARDPRAQVVKCVPQELSEKGTLRNVKKNK